MRAVRRLLLGVFLITLLSGIGVLAHRWWTAWRFLESTDNAYVKGEITVIAPRVAGQVVEVVVRDHQEVEPGQLLARIDDAPSRVALAVAEAELAAARARLQRLGHERRLAEARIAKAKAAVATAEAERAFADKELARVRRLAARRVAAAQNLDAAETRTRKAEAALAAARARLDEARAKLALVDSRTAELEAAVRAAESRVARARLQLSWTEIRAPIGGVVGARAVRVGQYVRPGQRLMVLVPLDRVWIEANFKETQIARLRPGQRVAVVADAFPDTPLEGRIEGFAPATGAEFSLLPPENATGNFTKIVQRVPVKIVLPPDHPLRGRLVPGLSVVVTVDLRDRPARGLADR